MRKEASDKKHAGGFKSKTRIVGSPSTIPPPSDAPRWAVNQQPVSLSSQSDTSMAHGSRSNSSTPLAHGSSSHTNTPIAGGSSSHANTPIAGSSNSHTSTPIVCGSSSHGIAHTLTPVSHTVSDIPSRRILSSISSVESDSSTTDDEYL